MAENYLSPVTVPISSLLARIELRYLLLADVTGSCRPTLNLFTNILLNVHTIGGRDLYFPKKRRVKMFPEESFTLPLTRISCISS